MDNVLLFPQPEEDEAEVIALLKDNEAWDAASKYLKRCLEHTIDELGKTENSRDKDEVLKGAKGTIEHVLNLPEIAKVKLEDVVTEEEMPALDERTTQKEEEE
jgi:hypothetical protein